MWMKNMLILLFVVLASIVIPNTTNAATYDVPIGDGSGYSGRSIVLSGYNKTQGFEQPIKAEFVGWGYGLTIRYYVPDDGSTWIISGSYIINYSGTDASYPFYAEVTTSGTFTGVSPGTATNAAKSAELAANAAKTAAESSNSIINNSLTVAAGVIQDASGTVLSEARLAKAKADLAATNAANAKTSADNAKTAADNAATKAGQAVTSITTAETNLTTKLNNVESKLNTVQTNLTNISTLLPPILSDVTGYNSATATTSTSFKVSLDYSNATEYRYKLDTGAWSAWTSLSTHDTNGYLTIPVSTNGAHTLSIEIQNSSTSLTAKGKMTFFKL